MNSCNFLNYNKKVWRPQFPESPPVINIVTNHRSKDYAKEEYTLRIKNIGLFDETDITVENVISKNESTSSTYQHFERPKVKRTISETNERVRTLNVIHLKHTTKTNRNSCTKQIMTIKKEQNIARKVYLKWSRYSSSTNEINSQFSIRSREHYLLQKYWTLWKKRASGKKHLHIAATRRKSSESSVTCAVKRKSKYSPVYRKVSPAEYKPEKSIIEAQRQKIEEQTNLIKELELARIKLENEKSSLETKHLLQECSKGEQKSRSTAKFLLNSNSIVTREKGVKYKDTWEFVTRMEVRAEERKKRWDAIKQRKEQLEEERIEKLKAEEEKKRKLEEEEKKKKIVLARQERERQEKLRKTQEEERLRLNALNQKAIEQYHKILLRTAMEGFKSFQTSRRLLMKEAENHFNEKILFRYFTLLKLHYKIQLQLKIEKADDFYNTILLRNGYRSFKLIHKTYTSNMQVAIDYYDHSLQKNYFYQWRIFLYKEKHANLKKCQLAAEEYEERLLQRSWHCWKNLSRVLFLEREKEHRIRLWCNKVQELLPDFQSSYEIC